MASRIDPKIPKFFKFIEGNTNGYYPVPIEIELAERDGYLPPEEWKRRSEHHIKHKTTRTIEIDLDEYDSTRSIGMFALPSGITMNVNIHIYANTRSPLIQLPTHYTGLGLSFSISNVGNLVFPREVNGQTTIMSVSKAVAEMKGIDNIKEIPKQDVEQILLNDILNKELGCNIDNIYLAYRTTVPTFGSFNV